MKDVADDDIFTYLSEVNTTEVFTNSNFEVNKTIKDVILSKLSITTLIIQIQNL